jgi:hypothetical protein
MSAAGIFGSFMEMSIRDPRIGPAHVSLFAAIVHLRLRSDGDQPLVAYGRELAKLAKISARTYHACMKDLVLGGYIRYEPSFNPAHGSLIYLLAGAGQSVS